MTNDLLILVIALLVVLLVVIEWRYRKLQASHLELKAQVPLSVKDARADALKRGHAALRPGA